MAQELTIRVCLVDLEDTEVSDIGTKDQRSSLSYVHSAIFLTSRCNHRITSLMIVEHLDERVKFEPVVALPYIQLSVVSVEDPQVDIVPYGRGKGLRFSKTFEVT